MPTNQPAESGKIYSVLCQMTGLPEGTDGQVVLEAHLAKLAIRRDAARLAAALRASAQSSPIHSAAGVRLLSRDEAEEVAVFGLGGRLMGERIEATERHYGKTIREALKDGDL